MATQVILLEHIEKLGGMGDIVLHPDYATNSLVYMSYREEGRGGSGTAVARARLARRYADHGPARRQQRCVLSADGAHGLPADPLVGVARVDGAHHRVSAQLEVLRALRRTADDVRRRTRRARRRVAGTVQVREH